LKGNNMQNSSFPPATGYGSPRRTAESPALPVNGEERAEKSGTGQEPGPDGPGRWARLWLRLLAWLAPMRDRCSRVCSGQAGTSTAEYAIATLAAVAFAGLLVVILRSDEVRGFLLNIIRTALAIP